MNQLVVRLNICLYQERNKKANQKHSHLHVYIADHFDPYGYTAKTMILFLKCRTVLWSVCMQNFYYDYYYYVGSRADLK